MSHYGELIPCSDEKAKAIEDVRDRIWQLYRGLKAYKKMADLKTKFTLEKCFDEIVDTRTVCEMLDATLRRIVRNKTELLLDRSDIPLYNNLSESDIRDYVKKRKISGSTCPNNGRCFRDTFASLKKPCRKLEVSF